ncbi:MAG: NAD-dependent epimerase/dehydratase family protein [Candidatus Korobacteraceae bacterium]
MRVLITGAAGNLGSLLTRHLLRTPIDLRLTIHKTPLPSDLAAAPGLTVFAANLHESRGLAEVCANVDCVVHLAGVLFAPNPHEFLPRTNVGFVRNLLDAAIAAGVSKFILVSFPHTEGETTPDNPARERLDRCPEVIHFQTRLAAERLVMERCQQAGVVPVICRAGVVYGRGVKLTEAALWLLRHRLLAVWRKSTWVHLISLPDFLQAVQLVIESDAALGIYNICDDQPLTFQEFLDKLALHHGYRRPWRLPEWCFRFAAMMCERFAALFGTSAPLTGDILRAGMMSSVADNSRFKRELLPVLQYPTLDCGLALFDSPHSRGNPPGRSER